MHRSILRSLQLLPLGVLAFVGTVLPPTNARASDPFLSIPDPAMVTATAAYRYANMTNDEALAECARRKLPFITVDPVPGVRAPIRLTGPMHGVSIHSNGPVNQRATSPFEILDARLALALDDFTAILEKHDIDEIEHFSMYRPGAKAKTTKAPASPEAQPTVDTAKPTEVPAKSAPEKAAPEAPVVAIQVVEKPANARKESNTPVTKKATTTKIVAQKKTAAPRIGIAKKVSPKVSPGTAAVVSPAMAGKTAQPNQEKPTGGSLQKSPTKPTAKHLGKAELHGKTAPGVAEHGLKHKEPGDVAETESKDKPVEVIAEPIRSTPAVSPVQPAGPVTTAGETRHPGGLAIDVGKLRKKDGTWLSVAKDFHGKIGDRACGPDAPVPDSGEAKELRALVCEAMADHLFTYILTPNYNTAHFDHFHIEIKPGVKWFLVH